MSIRNVKVMVNQTSKEFTIMAKPAGSSPSLYTISQVNALTGVPRSTIRFWEKEFSEFLVPLRTSGNQRRYNLTAVELIGQINQLVNVEGYTLEGARRKLHDFKAKRASHCDKGEAQLDDLAVTMSDLLLRKLFGQARVKEASQ